MVDMDKARLIDSSGISDADQFPWQLLFRHSHVTTQIMAAWKTSNILIVQRIANLTPRRRKNCLW